MKLFAVFSVLLVCLMLVLQGESCGYGGMPLRLSPLHLKPVRSTTRNKTAVLPSIVIHPQENDSVLSSIVEDGARRGLHECQKLFENTARPSKCPVEMYKKLPIFNNATFPYATREIGLMHAISAAAIAHEITYQCSQNKIPGCGCPSMPPKGFSGREVDWTWSGCGDNIEFGISESKRFTDRLENGKDVVAVVNLYNNEVGREVVRTSARLNCKCHGIATRCGLKTCWMELAPFKDVVSKLKEKYYKAWEVAFVDNKLHPLYSNGDFASLSRITRRQGPPLVYLDPSPGVCERNETLGYPGMLGHSCKKEASEDKCKMFTDICNYCKLKVKTVESYKQVKCRCKFVYCCKVECKTCTKKHSVMTCSL